MTHILLFYIYGINKKFHITIFGIYHYFIPPFDSNEHSLRERPLIRAEKKEPRLNDEAF